jgi:formamidase
MEMFVNNISADWGNLVNLVTFCEYAVSGFNPALLEEMAQPIPGPATERLAALAKKTGYYICNGSMIERAEDGLYNTSLIFGPDGEIVHRYSKACPWLPAENVKEGREFPVTDIPGVGKVGVMICYDGYFPEVARALAFNGAEIILWNSAGFHPLKALTTAVAQARAVENGCYVVLAAGSGIFLGLGLHGNSMFVDPNGVVISECGETETIMMDVVDAETVKTVRAEGTKGIFNVLADLSRLAHDFPQYKSAVSVK